MKGRKSFLAKVLAVAVTVTSVLPGGALSAQAAPTLQTEAEYQWMYSDEDQNFNMTQANWYDYGTSQEFGGFGENFVTGDATPTWHFQSLDTDGNGHGDLSANDAVATVYASGIDIKSQGVRRVMQFDLTQLNDNELRFGIMLKYVDEDHWVYLGQAGGKNDRGKVPYWYLEWKNGDTTAYCDNGSNYTAYSADDEAGETKKLDLAFGNLHLGEEKWFRDNPNDSEKDDKLEGQVFADNIRVTLTYESAYEINVRMVELEESVNEEGGKTYVEKEGTEKETLLDFKIFQDIRDAAAEKEIYFGFIGGTWTGTTGKERTDVNIMNVKKGALSSESATGEVWAEELKNVKFTDCKWRSPKTGDSVDSMIAPQAIGKGYTYGSIGEPDDEEIGNPDATIYNKTVTDFLEGEISAVLRPYEVGANKEYYLGVMALQDSSGSEGENSVPQSVKVGIKNDKWVYQIDNNAAVELGAEPAITEKTDYNVSIKIDENGKLTASAAIVNEEEETVPGEDENTEEETEEDSEQGTEGGANGSGGGNDAGNESVALDDAGEGTEEGTEDNGPVVLISGDKNVSVDGISGSITLSAKGILRVRDIKVHQVCYGPTPLEAKYNEILKKNDDFTFYTDLWTAFVNSTESGDMGSVKAALDAVQSTTIYTSESEGYTAFDETAASALQTKFNTFNNNANNKVATGRTALDDAIRAIEAELERDNANELYSNVEEITAKYNTAKSLLADIDAEDFDGITSTEVEEAISDIAVGNLTQNLAGEDDITGLESSIAEKISGIDLESDGQYYDGWDTFKAAVEAAQTVAGKESPTKKEIADALSALENASITLKQATADDKAALTSSIDGIVAAVEAKKYFEDEEWNTYTTLLQAARDAAAMDTITKKALDEALNKLIEAQGKLHEDTSSPNPPGGNGSGSNTDDGSNTGNGLNTGNGSNNGTGTGNDTDQGPKKGDVKTVGKATYTIVDPAAATVTLKTGDKTAKKVSIDKVTIDGKSYTIIGIEANAFKAGKMTSLTIGANVLTIGKNAFTNCKSLKSVTIGKKVTSIAASAFKKCTKLTKVTFKGTAVKTIAKNSFKGAKVKTVKVPKKLKKDKKFLAKVKKAGMKVKKLS